jgi:hypothetical protein
MQGLREIAAPDSVLDWSPAGFQAMCEFVGFGA